MQFQNHFHAFMTCKSGLTALLFIHISHNKEFQRLKEEIFTKILNIHYNTKMHVFHICSGLHENIREDLIKAFNS